MSLYFYYNLLIEKGYKVVDPNKMILEKEVEEDDCHERIIIFLKDEVVRHIVEPKNAEEMPVEKEYYKQSMFLSFDDIIWAEITKL